MWVYQPNCRTKVGAWWSPSFPRQSLARRRARNIVQVHAHALNGSWECYHVVRIGLGAIWGDHGRRRSLHFTTPHLCLKKGWVYPLLSISLHVLYSKRKLTLKTSTTYSTNTSVFVRTAHVLNQFRHMIPFHRCCGCYCTEGSDVFRFVLKTQLFLYPKNSSIQAGRPR